MVGGPKAARLQTDPRFDRLRPAGGTQDVAGECRMALHAIDDDAMGKHRVPVERVGDDPLGGQRLGTDRGDDPIDDGPVGIAEARIPSRLGHRPFTAARRGGRQRDRSRTRPALSPPSPRDVTPDQAPGSDCYHPRLHLR